MSFEFISENYKKKGYSRKNKRKTKLAEYALFIKTEEGLFWDKTIGDFLYHVEGDVTLAHTNDFLKRYKKTYEDTNFIQEDKGILSYTGNLNTTEFRKIARNYLDSEQYKQMKLQKENVSETQAKKPKAPSTRKRRKLAKASQNLILRAQHHQCAMCKTELSKLPVHYDHRIPLAMGGSDEIENIQALCPNCHAIKTQRDSLAISRARNR